MYRSTDVWSLNLGTGPLLGPTEETPFPVRQTPTRREGRDGGRTRGWVSEGSPVLGPSSQDSWPPTLRCRGGRSWPTLADRHPSAPTGGDLTPGEGRRRGVTVSGAPTGRPSQDGGGVSRPAVGRSKVVDYSKCLEVGVFFRVSPDLLVPVLRTPFRLPELRSVSARAGLR